MPTLCSRGMLGRSQQKTYVAFLPSAAPPMVSMFLGFPKMFTKARGALLTFFILLLPQDISFSMELSPLTMSQ
jgi:hypothetical protein